MDGGRSEDALRSKPASGQARVPFRCHKMAGCTATPSPLKSGFVGRSVAYMPNHADLDKEKYNQLRQEDDIMPGKFLINCLYGSDDLEKATVSMIIAGASAAKEDETAVFMTGEAVRMGTKGGVDGLGVENYPAMAELFNSYLRNKGQLWVCPACANARGINADDLVEGAEIAGAARSIAFLNAGAQLLA
ncbi:MAG: putative peroxiredoxin [bacterium]|jgi:predicted peroxiredoxin